MISPRYVREERRLNYSDLLAPGNIGSNEKNSASNTSSAQRRKLIARVG